MKLYEHIVNGQALGAPGSITIIHTKYGRLYVDLEIERKIQKIKGLTSGLCERETTREYDSLDSGFYGSIDTGTNEPQRERTNGRYDEYLPLLLLVPSS